MHGGQWWHQITEKQALTLLTTVPTSFPGTCSRCGGCRSCGCWWRHRRCCRRRCRSGSCRLWLPPGEGGSNSSWPADVCVPAHLGPMDCARDELMNMNMHVVLHALRPPSFAGAPAGCNCCSDRNGCCRGLSKLRRRRQHCTAAEMQQQTALPVAHVECQPVCCSSFSPTNAQGIHLTPPPNTPFCANMASIPSGPPCTILDHAPRFVVHSIHLS